MGNIQFDSSTTMHGALLVSKILHDADRNQQWFQVGSLIQAWHMA
jgi:hypothetical protein